MIEETTRDEEIEDHSIRLAKLEQHVGELRWHAEVTNERLTRLETQNQADDTARYVELRRIIKVIALTEIVDDWFGAEMPAESWDEGDWAQALAELYRRYSHLIVAGKPLWTGPPKTPSPETKALIAESLNRRQEA